MVFLSRHESTFRPLVEHDAEMEWILTTGRFPTRSDGGDEDSVRFWRKNGIPHGVPEVMKRVLDAYRSTLLFILKYLSPNTKMYYVLTISLTAYIEDLSSLLRTQTDSSQRHLLHIQQQDDLANQRSEAQKRVDHLQFKLRDELTKCWTNVEYLVTKLNKLLEGGSTANTLWLYMFATEQAMEFTIMMRNLCHLLPVPRDRAFV